MQHDEDLLLHYGVLGMKWGVRKQRPSSGKSKGSSRLKKGADKVKSVLSKRKKKASAKNQNESVKKKKVSEMTDDELRKVISRLQLEKQYKDLTSNPQQTAAGKKLAAQIMSQASVNISNQLSNKIGQILAVELEKQWKKKSKL